MNKQEFAENILNLKFDVFDFQKIYLEMESYQNKLCFSIIKELKENFKSQRNKKDKHIEEIKEILNLKDSDISQKEIEILSTGNVHKLIFLSEKEGENYKTLFIRDNIILDPKISYEGNINNIYFYPYHKDIITDYQPEKYDFKNIHAKFDLKTKLNSSQKYKKINHIIFVLKEYIYRYSRGISDINDAYIEYFLNKIYAYIILDEKEIEKNILKEIFEIKKMILEKIHFSRGSQKNELIELFEYLNFQEKDCHVCQDIKNPDYKKIYTDNLVTVIFSEKDFDIKVLPKNHIHGFNDIHHDYYSYLSKISYFVNKIIVQSNLIKESYLITKDSLNTPKENHIHVHIKLEFIKNNLEIKNKFLNFIEKIDVYSFIKEHERFNIDK